MSFSLDGSKQLGLSYGISRFSTDFRPFHLVFDLEGNLLASERYRDRLQIFLESDLNAKTTAKGIRIGSGTQPGKVKCPGGVTVDLEGDWVVCDTGFKFLPRKGSTKDILELNRVRVMWQWTLGIGIL